MPFATHALSDAIVIVGLDADMSSGAAVGGRPMRLSAVPRIVYAAKTFGEAERRLANERFDLVILDLMLPDGVEPTITDRDFTIATVAAPTVVAEETAAEGEEGEEGEEGGVSEDAAGEEAVATEETED